MKKYRINEKKTAPQFERAITFLPSVVTEGLFQSEGKIFFKTTHPLFDRERDTQLQEEALRAMGPTQGIKPILCLRNLNSYSQGGQGLPLTGRNFWLYRNSLFKDYPQFKTLDMVELEILPHQNLSIAKTGTGGWEPWNGTDGSGTVWTILPELEPTQILEYYRYFNDPRQRNNEHFSPRLLKRKDVLFTNRVNLQGSLEDEIYSIGWKEPIPGETVRTNLLHVRDYEWLRSVKQFEYLFLMFGSSGKTQQATIWGTIILKYGDCILEEVED
jgi:hypothetical protein